MQRNQSAESTSTPRPKITLGIRLNASDVKWIVLVGCMLGVLLAMGLAAADTITRASRSAGENVGGSLFSAMRLLELTAASVALSTFFAWNQTTRDGHPKAGGISQLVIPGVALLVVLFRSRATDEFTPLVARVIVIVLSFWLASTTLAKLRRR